MLHSSAPAQGELGRSPLQDLGLREENISLPLLFAAPAEKIASLRVCDARQADGASLGIRVPGAPLAAPWGAAVGH
jgi:hypothetical protein